MSGESQHRWKGWTEAADGTRLFTRHWSARDPVARAVLVHGLGDHSGRYGGWAGAMAWRGIPVTGFDLRGHGRSPGRRGDMPSMAVALSDVRTVERVSARRVGDGVPAFLIGHSFGGLLVLLCAMEEALPGVRGVLVSAPWLRTRAPVPGWKESLGRILSRVAPAWTLETGLDPEGLSRDPDWIQAYREDPLVHQRISPRLYDAVGRAQGRVLRGGLNVPTLFLVPDEDPLVDPGASRALAEREGVDLATFPGFRHEGFGEVGREAFIQAAADWILGCASGRADQNHRSG